MYDYPSLYILILNFNSYKETLNLFENLQVNILSIAKVIVIDNNSNSINKEYLRKNIPSNQLIQLYKNSGYATGNNHGIKKAIHDNANAILILNPDIKIQPDVIIKLYEKFNTLSDVAAIGTRICYRNKPEIIYSDGGLIDKQKGFHTYHLNTGKSIHEIESKSLNKVDYVNGSVFMVKTDVFEKVGLMIESFFLYFEETEWCLRAKAQGFKLYVDPSLTAYHLSSSKNKSYHFYMTRNRLWLAKKYPDYYQITFKIVKRQVIKLFIKRLKGLKLPDRNLMSKLKGLILGHITNVK